MGRAMDMCIYYIVSWNVCVARGVAYVVTGLVKSRPREVIELRIALTTNLGWLAVPFLVIVAVGYMWIVSALLGREQRPRIREARIDRDRAA